MKNKQRMCTCRHTAKHHKQSGRCRPGCDCKAALRRAQAKGKPVKGKT